MTFGVAYGPGAAAEPKAAQSLRRSLSVRQVVVLTLSGLSPAASVYITGSAVLHMAGTGAAAALLLGGGVAVLASLLYAELGAAFPRAGGVYPGITEVLGRGAGFVAVMLGLITAPATLAFLSLGFADYLRVFAPGLPKLPLAFAALVSAALLGALNIRAGAWVAGAFLAIEILALLVLTLTAGLNPARGLGEVLLHPVMLGPQRQLVATQGWTLALATVSGAYACAGSGLAIYFAEEMRGPFSQVGGVVAWVGVIAAVIVIIPLVMLTLSVAPIAPILSAEAPIAAYLTGTVGPLAAYLTSLTVALAILNNIIASMLAFSRFLYATGRDGMWPRAVSAWAARLNARFGSPWAASLALALVAGLLCLVGERGLLVVLSGEVFTATLVAASVLIGRRRGLTGATSFRSPLFPLLPLIGFMIVGAFIAADWRDVTAGRPSLCLLAGIVLSATVYHYLFGHRSAAPKRQGSSQAPTPQ